ncbi:MAG: hypothetical protein PHX09_04150 [Clostridia bacterium]|nr:hypothetical protein [Clostridia bacterium]
MIFWKIARIIIFLLFVFNMSENLSNQISYGFDCRASAVSI